MELYIMKASDIKSNFGPTVYDHTPGSKRGRENSYEKFRYVVGRDGPEKLADLVQSFESNVEDIWEKRKWTREDCFFSFGEGSPNATVSQSHQIELRGLRAVSDALIPFEARAPMRHNEATDILFWHNGRSVRVSLKTAQYHHLNKERMVFSGFQFDLKKAYHSQYCDIIIAVQFNLPDRTQAVAAFVFVAASIYNTNRKRFCWNKSAHHDKKFHLTNEAGRQAFKESVRSFMRSNEERIIEK
ncbi:unnamed protein product [Phaeothamnion confervicola]